MISIDVDTAVTAPVNVVPLTDDTDFKTIKADLAYNAAGMALQWNFVTTAGVVTQTDVTPTTGGGSYDWGIVGKGMYKIGMPASGGASINNNTEGFGYFSGVATGVLAWRSPTFCFRAAGINNKLIDDAWSATRGMTGTAVPDAPADAAGGMVISDAGGLDVDAKLAHTNEVTAARMGALTDWLNGGRLDLLLDAILADVTGIDGAAMRGTDSAALAATALTNVTWTDARAGYIDKLNFVGNIAIDGGSMNVASISGDTAAADALEAMLDGTGAAMYLNRLDIVGSLTGRGVVKIENTAADATGLTIEGLGAGVAITGVSAGIQISGTFLGVSIDGNTGLYISGAAMGINVESPDCIKLSDPGTGGPGMITAAFSSALITQIQAGLAVPGDEMDIIDAPNATALNAAADAILDRANAVETGWSLRKVMRIIAAALGGKLAGAATTTNTIRSITDEKARITATVDADGNRSSITLDGD